jgi:hypothetical protein
MKCLQRDLLNYCFRFLCFCDLSRLLPASQGIKSIVFYHLTFRPFEHCSCGNDELVSFVFLTILREPDPLLTGNLSILRENQKLSGTKHGNRIMWLLHLYGKFVACENLSWSFTGPHFDKFFDGEMNIAVNNFESDFSLALHSFCDCLDSYRLWFCAKVIRIDDQANSIYVHFLGWNFTFIEEIQRDEFPRRLAPIGTHVNEYPARFRDAIRKRRGVAMDSE